MHAVFFLLIISFTDHLENGLQGEEFSNQINDLLLGNIYISLSDCEEWGVHGKKKIQKE